jgi:hypothetical protein
MAILTENIHAFGFMVSEANGYKSRDSVTVAAGSATYLPGTLLGKITSSGNYVQYAPGATDGSQTVAGILCGTLVASTAKKTVISRDAEVNGGNLTYPAGSNAAAIATANAALAVLGIIVR